MDTWSSGEMQARGTQPLISSTGSWCFLVLMVGPVVLVGFSFNTEMPASQRRHLSLLFSPCSSMPFLVTGCGACGRDRMEVSQFFLCSLNLRWPCAHRPEDVAFSVYRRTLLWNQTLHCLYLCGVGL